MISIVTEQEMEAKHIKEKKIWNIHQTLPPSAAFMSIEDCRKLCNKTDKCTELTGVIIKKREGDKHDCYRKSNVKLLECDETVSESFELKVQSKFQ